jgi:hypothetical protein
MHALMERSAEKQREELKRQEAVVAAAQGDAAAAASQLQSADRDHRAALARCAEEVRLARAAVAEEKAAAADQAKNALETLTALQDAVRHLEGEVNDNKSKNRELAQESALLLKRVAQSGNSDLNTLRTLHSEFVSALKLLKEKQEATEVRIWWVQNCRSMLVGRMKHFDFISVSWL